MRSPEVGGNDRREEAKREAHRAFIPSPNDALKGLASSPVLRLEELLNQPGNLGLLLEMGDVGRSVDNLHPRTGDTAGELLGIDGGDKPVILAPNNEGGGPEGAGSRRGLRGAAYGEGRPAAFSIG